MPGAGSPITAASAPRRLRVAGGLSLLFACGFLVAPDYAWIMGVTAALFLCTAGVIPISEAALAHLVSRGGTLDAGRYGRVRVWGSVGFILAVSTSGFLLQWFGVGRFPFAVIALLGLLLVAAVRRSTSRCSDPIRRLEK